MHLACVNLRLSMPEALVAATINAAAALGMSDSHGSLEVGKRGDMLILNADKCVKVILLLQWTFIVEDKRKRAKFNQSKNVYIAQMC